MVFSQTSVNTQQLLKLVEINRLKSEKNQQVNDPTGVIIGGTTDSPLSSPLASTSFSEEFLETEPLFANTMLHGADGEFFQSLAPWCAGHAEEEVQSIDPQKISEERAHKTDTLHTQFSPQGGEIFDAISPSAHSIQSYPVSPNVDGFNNSYMDYFNNTHLNNNIPFYEQFVDINNLPVVISDLASENVDVNMSMEPWEDYSYTKQNTHNTMPFIHQDDSMDKKLVSVIPREVERNDMIISEDIIDDGWLKAPGNAVSGRCGYGLTVDVHASALPDVISTPDVLSFVEQLETEKSIVPSSNSIPEQAQPTFKESSSVDNSPHTIDFFFNSPKSEPCEDSEDETPKKRVGRKRQRHDSEESDETYTPHKEQYTPRKYRPRKASVPIKDMIKALEGAQKDAPKSRRGRPPKIQRRDSTVSTISNNSSMSTHEMKYRELRDKNNEASKRSRMNRKLKELQMEQLADDLEERNKKLRVQADMLSQRINELRKTFMFAVSQKKVG